ncbi:hypothetical protein F2Q69_00005474 [Brassica cretica]|uniref:Uncharacterized protein n=1 Tax=Brassica cretica TaxID=69181 RepID=A0A8S9NXX5_BRACR|nr:hypothetical protein F2Q69_00005474 [Brassica cretica]
MLHTAPTVAMKALSSNRKEFQLSLMSRTWKSTGTRALPIYTSRVVNASYQAWDYELFRITLLLQCNPLSHLLSDLVEHSRNVFFSLLGLSEEHPQPVGRIHGEMQAMPCEGI